MSGTPRPKWSIGIRRTVQGAASTRETSAWRWPTFRAVRTDDAPSDEEDFVIRPATKADGPRLRLLELETPIVAGEDEIVYDRAPDYFAFARVMERSDTVVAETHGELVGVHSAAFHRGVLNGEQVHLNYIHHLRIRPGAQGKSLFPKLKQVAVPRYPPGQSGSYAYVDKRNAAVLSRMRGTFDQWDPRPVLLEIDIATLLRDDAAGSSQARPAAPSDGDDIATLLEATHGHRELWPHPTGSDVAAKLNRSPSDYSWGDVFVDDRALVGLWRAGRTLEVRTVGPSGTTARRPAVLADYAYPRGAEAAFLALLRTALHECRSDGLTSLSVFATDRSEIAALLSPYADSIRTFEFVAARLPQPAAAEDLYVDPIYF